MTADAIIEANRVFSEAARSLDMPLFRTFTMPACFWERSYPHLHPGDSGHRGPCDKQALIGRVSRSSLKWGASMAGASTEPLQCSRRP